MYVCKDKADVMECGSHRGIKLLEHAVMILERVLEAKLCEQVETDNMQFGITPGKSSCGFNFHSETDSREIFIQETGTSDWPFCTLKRRLTENGERL